MSFQLCPSCELQASCQPHWHAAVATAKALSITQASACTQHIWQATSTQGETINDDPMVASACFLVTVIPGCCTLQTATFNLSCQPQRLLRSFWKSIHPGPFQLSGGGGREDWSDTGPALAFGGGGMRQHVYWRPPPSRSASAPKPQGARMASSALGSPGHPMIVGCSGMVAHEPGTASGTNENHPWQRSDSCSLAVSSGTPSGPEVNPTRGPTELP